MTHPKTITTPAGRLLELWSTPETDHLYAKYHIGHFGFFTRLHDGTCGFVVACGEYAPIEFQTEDEALAWLDARLDEHMEELTPPHQTGTRTVNIKTIALEAAAAEREACAKIVDGFLCEHPKCYCDGVPQAIKKAIRGRNP